MTNLWVGIGRLVAKPELRYTSSNIANTRFTIAIDRPFTSDGEKNTDFINCVAWRKTAENICSFMDKGSQIAIEGRIQTNNYTDKDGNNRTSFEVMTSNVQFLGNKRNDNVEENTTEQSSDPFEEFGEQVTIDDNFLE